MNVLRPVTFDRTFQIWEYKVSHSQLLLRSVKDSSKDTRIDILFKNVGIIFIPTLLAQIKIRETNPLAVSLVGDEDFLQGRRIFQIESAGYSGYVAAGIMVHLEDQGDYDEPSLLM